MINGAIPTTAPNQLNFKIMKKIWNQIKGIIKFNATNQHDLINEYSAIETRLNEGFNKMDRSYVWKTWEIRFLEKSAFRRLEKAYNASLYLLGCCMGNNDFPPGLFGNFITNDDMPWKSDYHLNYNFE